MLGLKSHAAIDGLALRAEKAARNRQLPPSAIAAILKVGVVSTVSHCNSENPVAKSTMQRGAQPMHALYDYQHHHQHQHPQPLQQIKFV